MNNCLRIGGVILSAAFIGGMPATASAGLFDALIQNVAKEALTNTVSGTANQAANNGAQPMVDLSGLTVRNGCYSDLPPAPPGLVADTNRNGCVDKDEAAVYLIAVSQSNGSAPQAASGGLMNALAGGAAQHVAGGGALPVGGSGFGWVAAQNAVGAAANAARNSNQQTAPVQVASNRQDNVVQAGAAIARGDVLMGKINGVKVHADANESSGVVLSLSKRDEVVYTGTEANGFLLVQTNSGEGWVNKLMVSKN